MTRHELILVTAYYANGKPAVMLVTFDRNVYNNSEYIDQVVVFTVEQMNDLLNTDMWSQDRTMTWEQWHDYKRSFVNQHGSGSRKNEDDK